MDYEWIEKTIFKNQIKKEKNRKSMSKFREQKKMWTKKTTIEK